MVVQHNLTAMNANRYLGINNSKLSKSLEKLSSGYAINRAGDNAAGLAVSEKMRSQIAGMTQGVKNAQDGISMVQTFEGALTETDSILQRMKTLADQMANGSYDDPIDRTAAQQEFLQLNDELDQIADTDFNGVIVLNGGKMADGLEQVDGLFDYANKAGQVKVANDAILAEAQKTAQAAIDKAQSAYDKAVTAFNETGYDITKNGATAEYNTIDSKGLTQAMMDTNWTADVGANAGDSLTKAGATEVTVTYEATVADDGTVNWAVYSASSNATDKSVFTEDQLKTFVGNQFGTPNNVPTGTPGDPSGKGGFTLDATNTGTTNVIFNESDVKTGDTVTLVFTNAKSATAAPTNVGFDQNSIVKNKTAGTTDFATPTIALSASTTDALKDDDMNENVKAVLDALNDSTIKGTKTGTTANKFDKVELNGEAITNGGSAITLKDADGNAILDEKGNKVEVWAAKTDAGVVTLSTVDRTGGTAAKGKELAVVTLGAVAADVKGTVEAGLAFESYAYDASQTKFGISAGANDAQETSATGKAKLDAAKKVLDDAKAAYPKSIEDVANYKVSKSDAFDKSEAKMTYKDSITLQTGARTKDAVNFTFKYNSDAIGDLAADLNCTAKGLGTSELNLSTQEAANYAIDKIDQAINKVSLVRGTFGAIQNRLEHKIDNMNVSIENLTSAESQIRDTNMPQEMMNFTKQQILAQASQSMLAQANQLPQSVLSLLQ